MEFELGWVLIGLGVLGWIVALLMARGGGGADRSTRTVQVGRDLTGTAVAGDVHGGIQQGGTGGPPPVPPKPEKKDGWERFDKVIKLVSSLVLLVGAVIELLGD